jgi:hypothetical protein
LPLLISYNESILYYRWCLPIVYTIGLNIPLVYTIGIIMENRFLMDPPKRNGEKDG